MKKIILCSLILGVMIATTGIVVAAGTEKVGGENSRYLVKSDNGILKMVFGVNHKFDSGFTTDLSKGQLKFLNRLGIETEEVEIYTISARPSCGDGKCHPVQENAETCPEDCDGSEPEPCTPSDQYPEGIVKVNGGIGGGGIIVAVLDTGVDTSHPDLMGNIVDCSAVGYESCEDDNGHGTHVAGTIAANGGDGLGIYGVAPEAKLIAIKVLDEKGRGYTDDIAEGMMYAVNNGANIISMSLGGSESDFISDAVDYANEKGVLVIAAAGNSGPNEDTIIYPAANEKVVAVGAIYYKDYEDTFSWRTCIDVAPEDGDAACWSSRGINDDDDLIITVKEVEFGAPGVFIESTWNDGCYNTISGTSMATPHVAGLAAKLWEGTALGTREYLKSIAIDVYADGYDTTTGYGLPIAP